MRAQARPGSLSRRAGSMASRALRSLRCRPIRVHPRGDRATSGGGSEDDDRRRRPRLDHGRRTPGPPAPGGDAAAALGTGRWRSCGGVRHHPTATIRAVARHAYDVGTRDDHVGGRSTTTPPPPARPPRPARLLPRPVVARRAAGGDDPGLRLHELGPTEPRHDDVRAVGSTAEQILIADTTRGSGCGSLLDQPTAPDRSPGCLLDLSAAGVSVAWANDSGSSTRRRSPSTMPSRPS